jgi:hypothetical protein
MQDTTVREALLAYSTDEPPMTFTSTDVMNAVQRSRRWRLEYGCRQQLAPRAERSR